MELSLGLEVSFPGGLEIYFKSFYYKIKIRNKDFVKIKIDPSESARIKDIVSRVYNCRCSLEWLYLPLDNVKIKEGISTKDLKDICGF
jgi:hypothetical protein